MSRSYGVKKDFSLHRDGDQESTVASPPQSMSSYRSTMPAYDLHQHRGRGQHGKLNISSNDTEHGFRSGKEAGSSKPSRDKSESAAKEREKKSRGSGWFGGKKKKRTEKVSDSVFNGFERNNMARVSPMLPIRSTMRSDDDTDQFGRPHAAPEEPGDEELRMKLSYDPPIDLSKGSNELIRLSLLPSNATKPTDTLQVTLRKRGHGFGLHLSSGLPPIKVTYIEPGGEAEAAGVKVGDKVLEVNGEDCEKLRDPAKIVALKLMIQQTDIREASGELGIDSEEESSGLNDSTWYKIQARQHQEEKESKTSSNVELTQIDGTSDTESQTGPDTFSDKAGKDLQQDKVEISSTEWERMREQRELIFDKNAPSSIIQEKSRKKETERSMEPVPSVKRSAVVPEVIRKQEEGGITGGTPVTDKPSPEKVKSSGGLFKRKKKTSVPTKQSNGTTGSSGEGGGVTTKKDREKTAGKKHKKAQCEEVVKQDVRSPTHSGATRKKGDKLKGIGVQVMKVTNIDDVEEDVKKVSDAEMTECIRKTFSYEGQVLPQDSKEPSNSALPRSHSHNTSLKVSPLPTVQKQNGGPQSGFPVVSHKRSRSYHGEDEEEGTETKLNVEARTASKSQSNINKLKPEAKVEIDSNLRVKKSGVVKGSSSRGRPTLEVFGSAERKAKRKGAERSEQTDSTDGPGLDEYPTGGKVDLGAIPHTNPSLGCNSGRTRRDLVSRSSVKRRPPSKKGSILRQIDESQKMGTKRVELSATHHTPTHTMPEKVSGNLIEATPPTSSVESATNHKNHSPTKSSETRNILKELLQRENKPEKKEKEDDRAALIQQQSSDTSSASSAALVAQAVATKEQVSSEEKMSPQVQGNRELSSLHGGTAGSNILAELQDEKRVLKDKEEGRKEESEKKEAEGERGTSSFASLSRRRNKTVEKPVKSLGIASDPGPHTPQPHLPMVSLRKTPVSESRPPAISSPTTPSWVAMAEKKKQRVSAMLEKKASAKTETPLPLQELPSQPASSLTPTSPPVTSFAPPPITSPTSPVTSSTSGVFSFTSMPITSPTFPVTSPTSRPVTSPISPPITSPTSPVTSPTSRPITNPTSPPITTPTPPPITTTTPSQRRTSEVKMVNSIASEKSEIPRKGHVRDRMALFQ